ncbi:hypothetical protein JGI23_00366 [Candidatus Chrysopegis kryptomonas]|uniref:Uncharacterized protein n=1 Tax=Candidatus Chryseopegocella kryptomonas TaxID=1633643 RepID=A0A0P1MQD3_9BACT|nr:hypothetical protein JGI23_00366 [Candidatus Chrysopegis kryptomonas]
MSFNLVSTLRIFLGLVFVFSGIAKGIDFEWFTGVVRGFGIYSFFVFCEDKWICRWMWMFW